MKFVFFSLLLLLPQLLNASVIVEKIQMPAWLVKDNHKSALLPGTKLTQGDTILTGEASKVYLQLEEGSRIKIGSNGKFEIASIRKAETQAFQQNNIFTAVFNVIKGAFRFTTNELFKNSSRNININVGTVTAGIRGTDLWGRSEQDNDLVCLIEGNISITRDGINETVLNEPSTYVTAESSTALSSIQYVSDEELSQWAATTEISENGVYITATSKYTVQLLSVKKRSAAELLSKKINNAGYASQIYEASLNNQKWYRVSVTGFVSLDGARVFASQIIGKFTNNTPWVF